MKIALRRRTLTEALARVIKVVPTSKTVPVLTHLHLRVDSEGLWITGTDLINWVILRVDCKVGEHGSTLVPAQPFYQFLRTCTAEALALVSAGQGIECRIGTSQFHLKAPTVDQYPDRPTFWSQWTHSLDVADLAANLRLVRKAAARDSFNARLEQVAIRAGKLQAGDGIRFHQIDLPGAEHIDIALPMHFLDDVLGLLGQAQGTTVELSISEDGQALAVRDGFTTVFTLARRDPFPDLSQSFAHPLLSNDQHLTCNRADLMAAVRRVRIVADETSNAITLTTQGFDQLLVSAKQAAGAWARDSLSAAWTGPERSLVFDHHQLIDLLALFPDSEDVTLRLGDDTKAQLSPLVISTPTRTGVLMQLRTDWQR